MAVDVNTVYQRVLAIANKEQRGYITPQEFNLFANQAQMKIFEQYFYDLNQFKRLPGHNAEDVDVVSIIQEKITKFYKYLAAVEPESDGDLDLSASTLSDIYRLVEVRINYDTTDSTYIQNIAEEITLQDHRYQEFGPLTEPTLSRPVFKRYETTLRGYPTPNAASYPNSKYYLTYIKAPAQVNWNYNIVVGQALYNASDSSDFELHRSEETSLVNEILRLAGIMMEKPNLSAAADREEDKKTLNEKR